MRTIFMGTPEFALDSLRVLAENTDLQAVVTQPDRPRGRSGKPVPPPVKQLALDRGLQIFQPEKIRDKAILAELAALAPELIVVAAYGEFLPEALLNTPKRGCLNVHASLLPKHRGASPIETAIISGEEETGVTIMRTVKAMDAGDILLAERCAITPEDTGGSLAEKLAPLGAMALAKALALVESGTDTYTPQDSSLATFAPMLTKETGRVDWKAPARHIINLCRALCPREPAAARLGGEQVKLWRAELCEAIGTPGSITGVTKAGIAVCAGDGGVLITELQPLSGKRMSAADYARGRKLV